MQTDRSGELYIYFIYNNITVLLEIVAQSLREQRLQF